MNWFIIFCAHIDRNATGQASNNWHVVVNDPFGGGACQKSTYPKQVETTFLLVRIGRGAKTLHLFDEFIIAKGYAIEDVDVVIRACTNGH